MAVLDLTVQIRAQNQIMCYETQSRWLLHTAVKECPSSASGKPVNKVHSLMASPGLISHSSLRSCSHFKRTLIPCYMYDSWWVCWKAFRFIIKWMKQYLCESKLIQMFTHVSSRLCLRPTRNLIVNSNGNLLVFQKWKVAGCILWALVSYSVLHVGRDAKISSYL